MTDEMTSREKEELFLGIHGDETYESWTEEVARSTARELGVEMTDAHWEVVKFLRLHYADGGSFDHARELMEVLEERFSDKGGLRYLYQLFPDGPVSMAGKIAGVPVPADAKDPSFGSVM